MAARNSILGSLIRFAGYGEMKGKSGKGVLSSLTENSAELQVEGNGRVSAKQFRLADGALAGSNSERGFQIVPDQLAELRRAAAGPSAVAAKKSPAAQTAEVEAARSEKAKQKTASAVKKALGIPTQETKNVKTKTPSTKTTAAPAAAKTATVSKNGNSAKASAASAKTGMPVKTASAKPASAVKGKTNEKTGKAVQAKVATAKTGGMRAKVGPSKAEERNASKPFPHKWNGKKVQKPGADEAQVYMSPLMFQDLLHHELSKDKGPAGFASLRKAAADEQTPTAASYTYMNVGEPAAKCLMALLERNYDTDGGSGFATWNARLAGGYQRAARRIAEDLASVFDSISVPTVMKFKKSSASKPAAKAAAKTAEKTATAKTTKTASAKTAAPAAEKTTGKPAAKTVAKTAAKPSAADRLKAAKKASKA